MNKLVSSIFFLWWPKSFNEYKKKKHLDQKNFNKYKFFMTINDKCFHEIGSPIIYKMISYVKEFTFSYINLDCL